MSGTHELTPCPVRTAWLVARERARHQLLAGGRIFEDPYALRIVGSGDGADLRLEPCTGENDRLRFLVVARSRIAEDVLAAAAARGSRQVVVLGAGLDTSGLRHGARMTVWKLDRPEMSEWKEATLRGLGLESPEGLRFVPADFNEGRWRGALHAAGFDATQPAVFIWLGVTYYIPAEATRLTLQTVAAVPGGEIVFDYGEPNENYPEPERGAMERRRDLLARMGEPMLGLMQPDALAAMLAEAGLERVREDTPRDLVQRFTPAGHPSRETARAYGTRVVHARSR